MSGTERRIICRRCAEPINLDLDSCPHCGADIRGQRGYVVGLLLGLIIIGATVLDIGSLWPFTLIGVLLAFGGGYFMWDRRQRIHRASEA